MCAVPWGILIKEGASFVENAAGWGEREREGAPAVFLLTVLQYLTSWAGVQERG